MPRELVGVWKASAAPYADRFLELTQHTITFGTGKESVAVHPIIRLEAVRKDQLIVYTVSYLEEDVESRLSFSYEATQQGGMIRLRHREQIVWEKERTRSHETHLDPATPLR